MLVLEDVTRTYHLDNFWVLRELVGQRSSHDAVIQIFEESEIFFWQGSEAINFGCVFLNKMWYNVLFDLLLVIGWKCLLFMFDLDFSLQQRSERGWKWGMEMISKAHGSRLSEILALHGTGERSFTFLGVILVFQTFKFITVGDLWFLWSLCHTGSLISRFQVRFRSWTIWWACGCNFIQSSCSRFL